jgi:uncharacterized membrane protein YfcA
LRALLASPLGFLIGLSLGALGGGGSILAVPVLVYVAGQDAKAATATSLVLVGMTALVGIGPHLRAGRVRLQAGILFGAAGVGGAVVGSKLNEQVDPDVLLLAFSGVMLLAAAAMYRSARKRRAGLAAAAATPGAVGAAVAEHTAVRADTRTIVKVLLAGTGVGVLTGFFGVGGGFVIVPALVLALGFTMPEAVGTSLVVIVINSAVSLVTRLGAGGIEWEVVIPFAVSSMAGVLVGGRLAGRKDPSSLQIAFVGLLVAVAVYTMTRSVIALA